LPPISRHVIYSGSLLRACGAIGVAVVLVLAGCAGGGQPAKGIAGLEAAVLHAGDMPRGYREGDDSACGVPLAMEGNWPQLEPLFAETGPKRARSSSAGSGYPRAVNREV
jgi:hypothetical protein